MLFFIISFVISCCAIIILHYGIRKEKSEKLLHDFKKLCTIDSVVFEKKMKFIFKKLKYETKRYLSHIKTLISYGKEKYHTLLQVLKKTIRKKLFQSGTEEKPSKHIEELKK